MEETEEWIISVITEYHDNENAFFHTISRELFLEDIVKPPDLEEIVNVVVQTIDALRHSHLNDAIITFTSGEKYRTLGEANPVLLYNSVVWMYILEHATLVIEADPEMKAVLADKWIQKKAHKPFLGYKSALKYMKLFKNDYNIESMALNMSLIETNLTNLFSANFSNAYDGCYLLQNTGDPSPNWIHTYWILNLAFACKHTHHMGVICGLLFPSLIRSTGNVWLNRRLLTLKMVNTLSIDINEISNANYWDFHEIEAHLQRHLKLTSRKLMKTSNVVTL